MFASMKVLFQTHTSSSLDRQRRVKVRVGVPTAVAGPDRPRPYSQEQACLPPPPGSFFSGHVFPQCVCPSVQSGPRQAGRKSGKRTAFPSPGRVVLGSTRPLRAGGTWSLFGDFRRWLLSSLLGLALLTRTACPRYFLARSAREGIRRVRYEKMVQTR